MSAKVEADNYPLNWLRWLVVVAIVAVGVVGNSYYSDLGLLYRFLTLLALGLLAFFIAINTAQGAVIWSTVRESLTEVRKVVWPSVPETHQTTLIVVVLTIITAIILWGLDSFIGWIASLIIG